MTDYPEYERQQELACAGSHVPAYMQAIFDLWSDRPTLAGLVRAVYKGTDAGISVSFQLDDGSFLWNYNPQLCDESLVPRVRQIGFSSIVEGSEAEVPLQWLDLLDDRWETAEQATAEFERLVRDTNDEACRLWNVEHLEEPCDD